MEPMPNYPECDLDDPALPDTSIQDLAGITQNLHRTANTIEPAVSAANERRHIQSIAGASIKLNFIALLCLALSVTGNLYLGWYATHPVREYFASDNGRLFPMIPMSQPYRKTADVIQYAKDTVNRSFTLDFLNFRQQLEDTRASYTREGFKSFLDSLKASGVLDAVRERRMNMSISANTGVLTKEGIEDGRYIWLIELPIEIKLAGQTLELPPQRFLTIVRVERIPTLDSLEGIGVGQIVTKPL
jgi:intracellular multiplication protein IcmL